MQPALPKPLRQDSCQHPAGYPGRLHMPVLRGQNTASRPVPAYAPRVELSETTLVSHGVQRLSVIRTNENEVVSRRTYIRPVEVCDECLERLSEFKISLAESERTGQPIVRRPHEDPSAHSRSAECARARHRAILVNVRSGCRYTDAAAAQERCRGNHIPPSAVRVLPDCQRRRVGRFRTPPPLRSLVAERVDRIGARGACGG